MEKRKDQFAITTVCLVAIIILTSCLAFCMCCGMTAKADAANKQPDAEPYGVFTQLSLAMGIDKFGTPDVEIWAEAHNDFTLGFSTIQVYVELFSSLEYKDTCNGMTLEAANYIADLNINKSLICSNKINGVKRYWRAKLSYKFDSKGWSYKETPTVLYEADGRIDADLEM